MEKQKCTEYAWCEEDHTSNLSAPDLHVRFDRRKPRLGVLRHDLFLDGNAASLDIHESLDWEIPLMQVPSFVREMRAELDRIERAALGFMAVTQPLVRHTEPGQPTTEELQGVGL